VISRALFQALCSEFEPTVPIAHLGPADRIVHSPIFERSISKLLGGQESDLSAVEADLVKKKIEIELGGR
jgi:hypothetical protein